MTTHNGRGQDGNSGIPGDSRLPAATTPYEGVVLPSNGDPWTPEQQQAQAAQAQVQPPAGQPWGDPWGPGSAHGTQGGAHAGQGENHGTQGGAHGAQGDAQGLGTQGGAHGRHGGGQGTYGGAHAAPGAPRPPVAQPLPPEGAPLPPEGAPAPPPMPPAQPPGGIPQPLPGEQPYGSDPSYGGEAQSFPGAAPQGPYGQQPGADPYGRQPAGGDPYALPPQAAQGYGQDPYQPQHASPQPPSQPPPHQAQQPGDGGTQGRHALPPTGTPTAPPMPTGAPPMPAGAPPAPALPPEQPGADSEATQMIPPIMEAGPQGGQPGAFPGAGSEDGTQLLPPTPAGAEDGTQLLPPTPAGPVHPAAQAGGSDSEATQYIPPVADAPGDSEATQMLRPQSASGGPAGGGAPEGPQEGGRGTLPEFESLFRADPPGRSGADEPGSTQSMPVFDAAAARQHEREQGMAAQGFGGYEPQPQGRAARRDAERGRGRRSVPPGILITAGLAGVAVIGLLVGIGISGGGDDDKSPAANAKDASTEPSAEKKTSPPPDPAEEQAKKLDALLAHSNNSRAAVIRSVERIKSCKQLGQAAADLRNAAKQRNGLVTSLSKLKTDKIPGTAELNSSLARAWKSSAAADNHYAAWADQTGKKHGCHKGKARGTGQAVAGNRASGQATTAKKRAAELWNPTAKKYGLKERQFSEL